MKIISDSSLCPYFNLAAEQFFLDGTDDVFMIWRNERSVIIGKNQNAFAQVNLDFIEKHGIKVVRRLTGGGAVFHDKGNINYTFITDSEGEGIDFSRFTEPVCDALKNFGVDARLNGRNDLTAEDCKISGNAQCVYCTKDGRKRLLHHGTLLFSADISDMAGALKVSEDKLRSKGIKSVPSRVKNICNIEGYTGPTSPESFAAALLSYGEKRFLAQARELTEEEKQKIQALSDEKYSKWDWNFGASPEYSHSVSKRFPYGTVSVSLNVKHGIINDFCIEGDFFGVRDVSSLSERLCGKRLVGEDILPELKDVAEYISGAAPEDIAELILR